MLNLKFALRTLFKTPFVTIVAIVSLALGIGANAAIFSLFNQMLLRPLPVPEPGAAGQSGRARAQTGLDVVRPGRRLRRRCSATRCSAISRRCRPSSRRSARTSASAPTSRRAARRRTARGCSSPAAISRRWASSRRSAGCSGPSDDRTIGESHVVVLSHAYWQSRFGLDPGVLNQPIIVNGQTMTIVGVRRARVRRHDARRQADGCSRRSRCAASRSPFKGFDNRRSYWAYVFARLKPGVSIDQARAALGTQYHAIVNDVEVPLQKGMSPQTLERFKAKPLLIVDRARAGRAMSAAKRRRRSCCCFGVTAFVLIIACANIANLLLARSAVARRRNGRAAVDRRRPRTADSVNCSANRACSRCSAASAACWSRSGR